MKKLISIIIVFASLVFSQDRSIIFSTGTPDSTSGFLIDSNHSYANRFSVNVDFVLEAMNFFMTSENEDNSNIHISIREDLNGRPGELISEFSQWNYTIDFDHPFNYNLIQTTNLCVYLDSGNYYWFVVEAADDLTDVTWIYSNSPLYQIASSQDSGISWQTDVSYAGAGSIFGEQIYVQEASEGDLNSDFTTNVVDIVSLVSYVLGESSFNQEQLIIADLNRDGLINVVDIVAMVSIVLSPPIQVSDFNLEDINPASNYFSQEIGPSFFSGQVSAYYFGKQG